MPAISGKLFSGLAIMFNLVSMSTTGSTKAY